MQDHSKTAILLFAESAYKQAQKKVLVKDAVRNFELFTTLSRRNLKTVNDAGLDVYHFDEANQQGASFGKRISKAVQDVFSKGYLHVIVVGGDCPDLNSKDVQQVNQLLKAQDLVLGPDLRGGVYIIGLHRDSFNAELFETLSWQQASLRSSFSYYASDQRFSVHWLQPKADLNSSHDIKQYWRLSKVLRSIVERMPTFVASVLGGNEAIPLRLSIVEIDRRGP